MSFNNITAPDLIAMMGAGWNLGNTMDATRDGRGTPSQFETAWGNPITTNDMIKLLADTGFSTLRIPVTWDKHIGAGPEYQIEAEWMNRVQEIVDYGIDNGLIVIINLHHEDWIFPSYERYDEIETKLVAVWAQIAGRFGGYSEKLIFETMNEPRMRGTGQEWTGGTSEARDVINRWNDTIVKTIRVSEGHNPLRFIMVPTIAASAEEIPLKDFVLPDDKYVIASIHAYTPYNFALNTNAPNDNVFTSSTARDIDTLFKRLEHYLLSNGIYVVIGECGSVEKNNLESRADWAAYYSGKGAEYGIPCIWWDNGAQITPKGNEGFGIMDRRRLTWWYPSIVEAFLIPYQDR